MEQSIHDEILRNHPGVAGFSRTLLESPSEWGEAFLKNRDGSPRIFRSYQREDLDCTASRIAHMDGRSVGKTVNLAALVLHFCNTHKNESILVVAPFQGHLDTIIEEIELQLNHSEILRAGLAKGGRGRASIKRKPYYQIRFATGCVAYFRPAGDEGEAFRSLHVSLALVDEAAWLPEDAWTALRQCLNPGGVMRVYSTPNGIRNRTYYRITQSNKWKVFRWPSWKAPDWDSVLRNELLDFYGGANTVGWRHEVAGEHGAPTFGAFEITHVLRAVTDITEYRKVEINGDMFADCAGESQVRDRMLTVLNLPGGHGRYWMGCDLGYTSDPTELLIFEENDDEILSLVVRVHAERVAYPFLAEMIGMIDRIYNLTGIGIDRGGNGTAVEQELLHLDKFQNNCFYGRLSGYDFGGSITMGEDDAGKTIKKRTKEHMTSLISKLLNARKFRLPSQDGDVEDQLCTQSYTIGDRGVVYSKGNDHIVDAMRCAVLRRSQSVEPQYGTTEIFVCVTPVATDPIF